jgi:hypothetical protein
VPGGKDTSARQGLGPRARAEALLALAQRGIELVVAELGQQLLCVGGFGRDFRVGPQHAVALGRAIQAQRGARMRALPVAHLRQRFVGRIRRLLPEREPARRRLLRQVDVDHRQ